MPRYSTDRFFTQAWHLRPYKDVPLPVAIELAQTVTEACRWFHDRGHLFLGDPSAPAFPDEVVDEVCAALQHQLDKEGESRTRGAVCSHHGVSHTRWYRLDQLPVAQHEDIKIVQGEIEPKPARGDDLNRLFWKFDLPAGGQQRIRFDFAIEFPPSLLVQGLA